MSPEMTEKELEDVIGTGEVVLFYLREAERNLHSAKNWGIADMLLGGIVWGSDKLEKIKKASECLQRANRELQSFQDNLKEVQVNADLHINVGEFLALADYILDGIISNFIVQRKISKARKQVDNAYTQVESVVDTLRKQLGGSI